jgi:threonyl-tRNA synthetase
VKPKNVRPVMVHRAIFGSMERFMAILIEHYGGKWPVWISPRQVQIIPISAQHSDHCK